MKQSYSEKQEIIMSSTPIDNPGGRRVEFLHAVC